jgi:hypothetical protein
MREIFIASLVKDVLGPRNGPYEEIAGSNPSFEYITGVLGPLQPDLYERDIDAEAEIPLGESGVFEDEMDDSPVYQPPQFSPATDPRKRPPSMGISFTVYDPDERPSLSICLTYARYFFDRERKVWKRCPRYFIKEFDNVNRSLRLFIGQEGWECEENQAEVALYMIPRKVSENTYHIAIYVVNMMRPPPSEEPPSEERRFTEYCIFQPQIRVVCEGSTRVIPTFSRKGSTDKDEEVLNFLYRERAVKARGFLCSAMWKEIDPEREFNGELDFPRCKMEPPFYWVDGEILDEETRRRFTCPDVRSEFVPIYHIPSPKLDWDESYGPEPQLEASKLAECWDANLLRACLSPLIDGYRRWIQNLRTELDRLGSKRSIAKKLIQQLEEVEERMQRGLEILCQDEDARLAFCFANKALDTQFRWTKNEPLKWRPFQLAFWLMIIESLVDPKSRYREVCDLLWVPTGAGKTEAYLAVAIFQLAYRRRRALKRANGDRTGAGVSVITRYTLRLLTIQQFRRILSTMLACEYLRVYNLGRDERVGWRPEGCQIDEPFLWGTTPFYAGLWVGGKVTPNRLRDSWSGTERIPGAISILKGQAGEGEPAQVIECPACKAILSIPEKGLEPGSYDFYLVVQARGQLPDDFHDRFNGLFSQNDEVKMGLERVIPSTSPQYATLHVKISTSRTLRARDVEELWRRVFQTFQQLAHAPVSPARPGYFLREYAGSGRDRIEYDFDIYCPNPECPSHHPWIGGAPGGLIHGREPGLSGIVLPDGNRPIEVQEPFRLNPEEPYISVRIPIPALVVDDQVYHRIPSILVSTVDKFARPPFEPRSAAIFGNVEYHHCIYGYYRPGLHYSSQDSGGHPSPAGRGGRQYYVRVDRLDPPDLILQDELHLIEGPLGSLVGIYEAAVEFLCIEPNGFRPKYIASTATVRKAEEQVQSLFVRGLRIFPPPGLTIDDRFFTRDFEAHPLDDAIPGRLYLGICAPGRGAHTPTLRIWSRLLQTAWENRGHKNIDFYWTLTGYFNAIRELAGARALYRQDIPQRIVEIAGGNTRPIPDEHAQELSSRTSSTDLPAILHLLEKRYPNAQDALFTTSMFGTGVDIPRISLMVVHGQPKTTSTYIQSTGRVGRSCGGLVVVFLRAARPRDLNHYEFFCGYHRQLHRYVEPPTVYPFAPSVVEKALGPVIVYMLRNMRNTTRGWYRGEAARGIAECRHDAAELRVIPEFIRQRVECQPSTRRVLGSKILGVIASLLDRWSSIARRQADLVYNETVLRGLPRRSVVLGDPVHQHARASGRGLAVVYENVPQSLREVEETIALGE